MKRRTFLGAAAAIPLLSTLIGQSKVAHAGSMGKAEKKLKEMGIILPTPSKPVAVYAPYKIVGNMVYIAGQGPRQADGSHMTGKVGKDLTIEEGIEAARLTGIQILAQLKAACGGDLDRVVQAVQIHGIVNCPDGFKDSPKVINGTSQLLFDVFGEAGLGARAAVGTNSLPANIAVEVVASFEIKA